MNTYFYVHGNPVIFIDPDGLICRQTARRGMRCSASAPTEAETFFQGYTDHINDALNPMNPFAPGSCESNRRQQAINLAMAAVKAGLEHISITVNIAVNNGVNSYTLGRSAGNVTLSALLH